MERAALVRSMSSRYLCRRSISITALFPASAVTTRRSSLNVPRARSKTRLRLLPSSSCSPLFHFRNRSNHFSSSVSPRAALVSSPSPPEFAQVKDEVAHQLGFQKISEEFIPECKSKAVLFRHIKTGAEVMSLSNHDENKVFGIVFRTPP